MSEFARMLEDEFVGTCPKCGKGFYFCPDERCTRDGAQKGDE